MARRKNRVKAPDPVLEEELRAVTARLTEAHGLVRERDRIARALYERNGYTQRDLTAIINEHADPPITEDALQKAFKRADEAALAGVG